MEDGRPCVDWDLPQKTDNTNPSEPSRPLPFPPAWMLFPFQQGPIGACGSCATGSVVGRRLSAAPIPRQRVHGGLASGPEQRRFTLKVGLGARRTPEFRSGEVGESRGRPELRLGRAAPDPGWLALSLCLNA